MLCIYRYWSGIYHLFDSSGRWYGKGKCGIGIEMFDCLIVWASFSGRRVHTLLGVYTTPYKLFSTLPMAPKGKGKAAKAPAAAAGSSSRGGSGRGQGLKPTRRSVFNFSFSAGTGCFRTRRAFLRSLPVVPASMQQLRSRTWKLQGWHQTGNAAVNEGPVYSCLSLAMRR